MSVERSLWRSTSGALLLAILLGGCEEGDSTEFVEAVEVAREGFTALAVTPDDRTLSIGESLVLTATASRAGGDPVAVSGRVSWRSDNSAAIAVDSQGRITAHATGAATISASLAELRAEVRFTASDAPLADIRIDGASNVRVCGNLRLTATGVFSGEEANPRDITHRVEWRSAAPASAAFSPTEPGLLRSFAVDTLGVSAVLDGITGQRDVTVSGSLAKITLTPPDLALSIGESRQYRATATYDDASEADIGDNAEWAVSGSGVASVGNTDGSRGLVRALRTDTATVTASCAGQSGSTGLTVTAGRTLFALRVQDGENPIVINDGSSLELVAEALYTDGSTEDVTEDAEWSVEAISGSVVTLSNTDGSKGEVSTNGIGRSLVRVSFEGQAVTVELEVR